MKSFSLILASVSFILIISCNNSSTGSENNPPYNIISPAVTQQVDLPATAVTDFILVVDEQNNQRDPDSDDVLFMYSFVSQTQGVIGDIIVSMDVSNGIFSITHDSDMMGGFATFNFWTEDPDGLSSAEFSIEFWYEST